MNCQQFTSHIVEAARGRMMDAATRDGAMRHAETCAACAARLAQERNLTNALRTVAANMNGLSAPARVEAKLLAAFRESRANSGAATTNAAPSHVGQAAIVETAARVSSQRQRWRTAFVATAIAASLALVALLTLYQQFAQTSPSAGAKTNVVAQGGTEPSPAAPAVAVPSPPSDVAATAVLAQRARLQTARRDDSARPARHDDAQRASLKPARTATPKMIASRQVIDGGSAIFAAGEGESAANQAGAAAKSNEAESVTEFIPLVAGAPAAAPLESGQLVRVQLPRSALASLGLPLNAERGNETVKADVLLGGDGLAHAIRFVR
ncbi:MAG TPA: hypothetical protein VK388_14130 [Pyrinomonadaceae bacterium]|nr:hypothetical protein [Pyrinomonadaceae bacterium]